MDAFRFARQDYMLRCDASCFIFGYVLGRRFDRLRILDPAALGLTEFDADKTMRLFDKAWSERVRRLRGEGRKLFDLPVERDYNDKHGHRVAFPTGDEPYDAEKPKMKPVLDVMRAIDRFSPQAGRILVECEGDSDWGRVQLLQPQVSASMLLQRARGEIFGLEDITFFDRFGDACGRLSAREIISLGRHESPLATRNSLVWELDRWYSASQEALQALASGDIPENRSALDRVARLLWQSWSFALECKKKAGVVLPEKPKKDEYGADNESYESALRKLHVPSIGIDPEVLAMIDAVQRPASAVWGDSTVQALQFSAFGCWVFSCYLAGCLRHVEAFADSLLNSRLRSVDKGDVLRAFDDLTRFSNVPRKSRPAEFGSPSWHSFSGATTVANANVLVDPKALWSGTASVAHFVEGAVTVFDWLAQNYVLCEIEQLRVQQA